MSSFRTPVGPQPAHVYWRRRLVVGLGLVAVILVVVLIFVRPGAGDPSSASTNGPGPTDTATPAAPAEEAVECSTADIRIEAVTDDNSYQSGEKPLLSMAITNTGSQPCRMQVGTDVQEYRITSGSDFIWTSLHCQEPPQARETTIEPGETLTNEPFPWDRTRSSETTCDAERKQVIAGGATYRLKVIVGDFESAERPFLLY